jgi:hypothetical protein
MSSATPRNLDPKFKDATAPDEAGTESTESVDAVDDTTPMIVYRARFVDSNGVQQNKEFGPMPTADFASWLADYEAGKVK